MFNIISDDDMPPIIIIIIIIIRGCILKELTNGSAVNASSICAL
jgi:hypothetical protein